MALMGKEFGNPDTPKHKEVLVGKILLYLLQLPAVD